MLCAVADPAADYEIVRQELAMYNPEYCGRPHVVALNKMDLSDAAELHREVAQDILAVARRMQVTHRFWSVVYMYHKGRLSLCAPHVGVLQLVCRRTLPLLAGQECNINTRTMEFFIGCLLYIACLYIGAKIGRVGRLS